MAVKSRKATHGQLRRDNRQLLLRAVYLGLANSRADLAHQTGLAKPTVSDLIGELMEEGYLIETGFGQSTDEGGKRPRLLEFVPGARHVIGVSLNANRLSGVLSDLDGCVLVEHYQTLGGVQGPAVLNVLHEVINGLIAQISAPLLCIGVGVPGLVDSRAGIIRYAPNLGWQNMALADFLSAHYKVPAYVANSTELAAMAQYAFGDGQNANNLLTVLIDESVGVGMVLDGAVYHGGGEIGQLRINRYSGEGENGNSGQVDLLEKHLGWSHVNERSQSIQGRIMKSAHPNEAFNYLHLRRAILDGDADALDLQNELASYVAQIYAWAISLLRPDHISLAGSIADLGDSLLETTVKNTRQLVAPMLMNKLTFSLVNSPNLVPVGAVAYTLQQELGLV
jgi:N-acetylglucosamine repressor